MSQNCNQGRNKMYNSTPQKPFEWPNLQDKELLGEKANQVAEHISKDPKDLKKKLSSSQLRNFFTEVKRINRNLESNQNSQKEWETSYPQIKLIKARAIYNQNRKTGNITKYYCDFLSHYIDQIHSEYDSGIKNFKRFVQFFEAVVGYASQYCEK